MEISCILFLTSPKSYKILRQFLPLPNKLLLYQRFSTPLDDIIKQLSEIDEIAHVLNNFYNLAKKCISHSGRSKIISTLCIDNFSFKLYPRWTRILTSFAHAEMKERFAHKNGLKIHVQAE